MINYRALGICVPLLLCLGLDAAAQDGQKDTPALIVRLLTNDIQVSADGSSVQITHVEVRASNDAAALQVSQTSISYDSTSQEITVVDAHTLKPDGKILPVDASAIYDRAPPGQDPSIVTGMHAKLIVFPQFSAGDTAAYTVKITTSHPNFEHQFTY